MTASPEIRSAAGTKLAIHFGGDHELFGFYHPPTNDPNGRPSMSSVPTSGTGAGRTREAAALLVCPLGTDYTRSDRAYRHLAERLAAAGFPVLRYDHHGTGDSGADERAPGLVAGWLDDIGVAAAELRARSGATKIAIVGLRLGATFAMQYAARAADADAPDALVLWSPCSSGRAFVTEVVKLHKVYARIEPQMAKAAPILDDGEEALGMFLPRAVIADLGAIDLLALEKIATPRALVIDPGSLPNRDALIEQLERLGVRTELRTHTGQRFLTTVSHRAALPAEVLDSITSWLAAAYPAISEVAAPPSPAKPSAAEQPRVFGSERPRFGIFTPAAAAHRRPDRPPIVIANAGCVNRSGPHRLTTRLARRWAALGFDVLRVDLSGIGDTPVEPNTTENVTYPPGGLDDLREAIRSLAAPRAIVVGLCSGGDYAFQLGAHDAAHIASAVILNPRTFCMLDLQAVESADGNPPPTTVDNVPTTLRAIAGAGVETLLLVSQNDPGVAYVDAHFPAEMAALRTVPRFTRIDIDGSDHTFTPLSAQRLVEELVTDYLVQRYS